VIEESESEVRCGPADALECEETDKGRGCRIVGLPAKEKSGGEGVALGSGQYGLWMIGIRD